MAAEGMLADVSDAHRFVLSDGRIIKNLEELSVVLPSLNDAEFMSHVSEEKNDFKTWIEHCIHDVVLVKSLEGKTQRQAIENLITKRVEELKTETVAAPKVRHMISKLKTLKKTKPEHLVQADKDVPYVQIRRDCIRSPDLRSEAKEFIQGALIGFFIGLIVAFFF